MRRFFTLVLGALAMVAVALLSAFVAMRLAIHGREVRVPALAGLPMAEAARIASHDGLNLTLENRFYASDVPAGHILAQDPPAGSRVRRDWQVRITESLGAQRVSVPDLTGQSERAATVAIRRLSLDLGMVAHLPISGDADVVLTQTPAPNSGGADGPRLSILVSATPGPDDPGADAPTAYVMPPLVGLPYGVAAARAASAGLHLVPVAAAPAAGGPTGDASGSGAAAAPQPEEPVRPTGTITAQTPAPGRRVQRGEAVHVVLAEPGVPAGVSTPPQ